MSIESGKVASKASYVDLKFDKDRRDLTLIWPGVSENRNVIHYRQFSSGTKKFVSQPCRFCGGWQDQWGQGSHSPLTQKTCYTIASRASWKLVEMTVTTWHPKRLWTWFKCMLHRSIQSIREVDWNDCYTLASIACWKLLELAVGT